MLRLARIDEAATEVEKSAEFKVNPILATCLAHIRPHRASVCDKELAVAFTCFLRDCLPACPGAGLAGSLGIRGPATHCETQRKAAEEA